MFCVNNILLAQPSVKAIYFCPANLQSPLGQLCYLIRSVPCMFSIYPALYFYNINVSCLTLACCLHLKITARAEQTLTLFYFYRNAFHIDAPPIDLVKADNVKNLLAIQCLCPACLSGELSQTAPLHVDTGACLHNVRLTSTENAAAFCSYSRKSVGVIAEHV